LSELFIEALYAPMNSLLVGVCASFAGTDTQNRAKAIVAPHGIV
jgi:hypothetical protein